jgi:hypothetical protein
MNWVGRITVALFMAAWVAGVVCWFISAYYTVRSQVAWWKSRPPMSQMLENVFWFRRGLSISAFRAAWDNVPEAMKPHRRKALRFGVAFLGFAVLAALAGTIGDVWGGWSAISQ